MRILLRVLFLIVTIVLLSASSSFAWLYNGGEPQHLSVGVKDASSLEWAAQPFQIISDAYVMRIGIAVSKGYGPVGSGFDIYLAPGPSGLPESAIGHCTIVPSGATLTYYYADLDTPVRIKANTSYAVVLIPNSSNFYGSISLSAAAGFAGLGTSNYGDSWYALTRPLCVRVDGYAVPEPCSLGSLVIGSVLMIIRTRRLKPQTL